MCVCVYTFLYIVYMVCVCVFQGDASRCREAKGAVLAFLIIFNTVTQSESTLFCSVCELIHTDSFIYLEDLYS